MSDRAIVIATFHPKPGQEAATERVLRGMLAPTRSEPGCVRYDLYGTSGPPATFVLFEIYRDQAALEAHRNTDYFKAYRAAIAGLLAEPIHVQALREVDAAANA